MSWDSTTPPTPPGSCCQPNPVAPNGMHPDHHAVVVSQSNPGLFFDGSDGGLVRSDGAFKDISSQCTNARGLTGDNLALCQQLLSQVPKHLYSLNKGLSTLQFQSLSVAADNPKHLQGGTKTTEPSKRLARPRVATNNLRRRWPVGFQRWRLYAALQHLLRKLHGCEFPKRRSEQVGRYLGPLFSRPRHSTSRSSRILLSPGRFL